MGNTFETTTAGDGDGINLFANFEDALNVDGLLEEGGSEVNLLGNITTVNLNFDDLSLLGFEVGEFWLGVGNQSDDTAFLLELVEVFSELVWILLAESLVLSESGDLLWGLLVVSALARFSDVISPDSVSLAETSWGQDVTSDTSANHGWGIENGDVTNDLLDGLLISGTLFNETHV